MYNRGYTSIALVGDEFNFNDSFHCREEMMQRLRCYILDGEEDVPQFKDDGKIMLTIGPYGGHVGVSDDYYKAWERVYLPFYVVITGYDKQAKKWIDETPYGARSEGGYVHLPPRIVNDPHLLSMFVGMQRLFYQLYHVNKPKWDFLVSVLRQEDIEKVLEGDIDTATEMCKSVALFYANMFTNNDYHVTLTPFSDKNIANVLALLSNGKFSSLFTVDTKHHLFWMNTWEYGANQFGPHNLFQNTSPTIIKVAV